MTRLIGVGAAIAALLLPPLAVGMGTASETCDLSYSAAGPGLSVNLHACPFPVHHHHRDGQGCAPSQLLDLSHPSLVRDGADLAPPVGRAGSERLISAPLPAAAYSVTLPAPRAPPV